MKINSTYHYAWLCTYQLVISPEGDRECKDIAGWGSGFFLGHADRIFFVTADHNLHMRDHDEGERTGAENHLFIYNNITDRDLMAPILTPMGNFNFYDRYDYSPLFDAQVNPKDIDPEVLSIPDLVDVAFCEAQTNIEYPFLTHQLSVEELILAPAREQKLIIPSDSAAQPSTDSFFLVEGVVKNEIRGIQNLRQNAIFQDLIFAGEHDGIYLFSYPGTIHYDEWAALSGAPIFDHQCHWIGMVIRVSEYTNQVHVIPASAILKFIDNQMQIDNTSI